MRGGIAALALLLAPLAAAEPLAALPFAERTDFYGLASQGSLDEDQDWVLMGFVMCPQVVSIVHLRLVVLRAGADDVLQLRAPHLGGPDLTATARLGEPAELTVLQGDPCADFAVEALSVAGPALYRLESAPASP